MAVVSQIGKLVSSENADGRSGEDNPQRHLQHRKVVHLGRLFLSALWIGFGDKGAMATFIFEV